MTKKSPKRLPKYFILFLEIIMIFERISIVAVLCVGVIYCASPKITIFIFAFSCFSYWKYKQTRVSQYKMIIQKIASFYTTTIANTFIMDTLTPN